MRQTGAALLLLLAALSQARAQPEPEPELRALLLKAINTADSFEHRFDAEVWLADMSARIFRFVPKALPELHERLEFLTLVHQESKLAGVPPELVLSVIEIESRFDRFAVSRVGAQGYMQVMPFWLKELNRPYDNLFRPSTNLRMGCTILKFYLDRERGDLVKALARYNGSYGRREYPDKVLGALSRRWYRE